MTTGTGSLDLMNMLAADDELSSRSVTPAHVRAIVALLAGGAADSCTGGGGSKEAAGGAASAAAPAAAAATTTQYRVPAIQLLRKLSFIQIRTVHRRPPVLPIPEDLLHRRLRLGPALPCREKRGEEL